MFLSPFPTLSLLILLLSSCISADSSAAATSTAVASGTPAPGTSAAGTSAAGTPAPGTSAAATPASGTQASGTSAAGTSAAGTQAPGTSVTGTPASGTQASGTQASGTSAAGTSASGTAASGSVASGSAASGTSASGSGSGSGSAAASTSAASTSATNSTSLTPPPPPAASDLDSAIQNMHNTNSMTGIDFSQDSLSWDGTKVLGDCESLRRAYGLVITTYENPDCTGAANTTSEPYYSIGGEGTFRSFGIGNRSMWPQDQLNFSVAADFHDAQGHVYNWECSNTTSTLGPVNQGECLKPPKGGDGGAVQCWTLVSWADACQWERIQMFDASSGPVTGTVTGDSGDQPSYGRWDYDAD